MDRTKIANLAKQLFWRYGIRSVTMNDIANGLNISKKTLYQFFEDKAEIVRTVTQSQVDESREQHIRAASEAENAVEEIFIITQYHSKMNDEFHPSVLYDLKKYYPDSWQLFIEFKEDFCVQCIVQNLQKGIQEGLYYPHINPLIISKMRMEQVEIIYNPTVFPSDKFNSVDVYNQITKHFVYGILSDQGKILFQEYNKPVSH